MAYTYEYPRPMLTVDIIVTTIINNTQHILLINRLNEPYKNHWALPGGFIDLNEDVEHAAHRELLEETNIENTKLKQFKTYGTPFRDPRGHNVSIVYFTQVDANTNKPKAGDDAKSVEWFRLEDLPNLAFDHKQIIGDYIKLDAQA